MMNALSSSKYNISKTQSGSNRTHGNLDGATDVCVVHVRFRPLLTLSLFVTDSWIHCNDARMERCSLSDVMAAQAYILFYMQLDSSSPSSQSSSASSSQTLAINDDDDDQFFSTSPRPGTSREHPMDADSTTEIADDEITFNFKSSSLPRFDRLQGGRKRTAGNGSGRGRKPDVKRRKTMGW